MLPSLSEIRREIRSKATQTNYNVQYGFPPYRDFDFTSDLLRLYAELAQSDLEVGAFLLALDPLPRIPLEPQFRSAEVRSTGQKTKSKGAGK
jgi:hypothetical protein